MQLTPQTTLVNVDNINIDYRKILTVSISSQSSRRTNYHHGDLRHTLIAIGEEMLAEGGIASLSLRDLSKRAGVSHNAPYQHFPDKEAFVAAIAERGFHKLSEIIEADQKTVQNADMQSRLVAAGQSYVQFAVEHSNQFQIMFGQFLHSPTSALTQAAQSVLDKFGQIIIQAQQRNEIKGGDPTEIAMLLWMVVHGYSSALMAEKILPVTTGSWPSVERVERYIRMACEGLLRDEQND